MYFTGLFIILTVFHAGANPPKHLTTFLKSAESHTIPHPSLKGHTNHYYRLNKNQPQAIVFLPGMGESSLKYYDLPEDLPLSESTYYGWDHLGQGFSSHLLPTEPEKIHIHRFEDHLDPLVDFLKNVRSQHQNVIVLAHSMGAHLALRIAYEHPDLMDRLILSAPLIDIRSEVIPVSFLAWITSFLPAESYPPLYFFFKDKVFGENLVTQSAERLQTFQKTVEVYPQVKRKGATLGWIRAARQSIHIFSQYDFKNFKTPILILQAEDDALVDNKKQNAFCEQAPSCHLVQIQGSKHEILFEIDQIRDLALQKITQILQSSKTKGSSSLNKSVF